MTLAYNCRHCWDSKKTMNNIIRKNRGGFAKRGLHNLHCLENNNSSTR